MLYAANDNARPGLQWSGAIRKHPPFDWQALVQCAEQLNGGFDQELRSGAAKVD